MKLYIAGSSKDIDRCEAWIQAARAAGHEITVDWVAEMRASPPDALLDDERLARCAAEDLRGVREAEVVWLVAPPASKPSTGCWAELGAALILGKPTIYSAPPDGPPQFCIFTTLCRRFASDAEAFVYLAGGVAP